MLLQQRSFNIFISVVIIVIILLVVLGTQIGVIGPIRPTPTMQINVNDSIFAENEQVPITIGEPVNITIKMFEQDEMLPEGDFTYNYCYEPPVAGNPYCNISNYRVGTNQDFTAATSKPHVLEITVKHRLYRKVTAVITLKPQ